MKRRISALLLCAILCISAAVLYGCLPLSYAQERQGPAMWIVEDKDGRRCYLFGTVHTAKNGNMYPFADVIEDAYSYCDYVAVEADVTKPTDENTLDLYKLKDGTALKDHLSAETYDDAIKAIKEYEGDYNGQYDGYSAIYLYSLLDYYNTEKCGYKAEFGSDTYFINKAKNDGKEVYEIEGEAKQAELTLSLSDAVVEYFISSALKSKGNSTGLDYYDTVYKEGSVDLLSYSINSGKRAQYNNAELAAGMSEYYDLMFTQRNKTLADAVKKCLSDGERVFFALGISHIAGDGGVVSVLQSEGYRVIRK